MSGIPVEFKARLAVEPFRRTKKGTRLAALIANDMPERDLALLRRFTGLTLFEYLLAMDEHAEEMTAIAWSLHERKLITPCSEFER